MGTSLDIISPRRLTSEAVYAAICEINRERFGNSFEITPEPQWDSWSLNLKGLDPDARRWGYCGLRFELRTQRRLAAPWPRFDWNVWMFRVFVDHLTRRLACYQRNEEGDRFDPPEDDRWPTYRDWFREDRQYCIDNIDGYDFDAELSHILDGCPTHLLVLLGERAHLEVL